MECCVSPSRFRERVVSCFRQRGSRWSLALLNIPEIVCAPCIDFVMVWWVVWWLFDCAVICRVRRPRCCAVLCAVCENGVFPTKGRADERSLALACGLFVAFTPDVFVLVFFVQTFQKPRRKSVFLNCFRITFCAGHGFFARALCSDGPCMASL